MKIASFLPFPRAYEIGRFTHRKYTQAHLEYFKLSGYEEINEHYLSSKLLAKIYAAHMTHKW